MSEFKWGLIGPGRIAHRFAQALSAPETGRLYAVASSNAKRAEDFAAQYQAPVSYDNYPTLMTDPNVDAIYIATPHNFHFEQAAACLKAGKPVLCEKPLTVTAQQAKALIELSQTHQVFLMEALWSRFLPVYQQVKTWLNDGRIGQPKLVQSNFGFAIERNESDRLLNPDLAGGVLLDMGVYNLSMSQWVYGRKPEKAVAQGFVGATGVDELMNVSLDFGGGQLAQFCCNFLCDTENSLTIYGSKGQIKVNAMFWDTGRAELKTTDGKIERFDQAYSASGFEYQIQEAKRCIEAGKLESDLITHRMTLETMELMDELLAQVGVTSAKL